MTKTILWCALLACTYALPADKELLDKATANDVYANDLIAPLKIEANVPAVITSAPNRVESTTVPEVQKPAFPEGPFKPQQGPTMFARLIDDIFQIPITVLQSVAKLLTNPFKQHTHSTPEGTSTY